MRRHFSKRLPSPIATQTENAQTRVTVLDSRQREQYVWKTDNVVTALAMSDNGSAVGDCLLLCTGGRTKKCADGVEKRAGAKPL